MLYANNLNERLGIENEAVCSYSDYTEQRRLTLIKNSRNFACRKRSQGVNAANYASAPYSFMYPEFKTPVIDKTALKETIENRNITPQQAKNNIIKIFMRNLGDIYDKSFDKEFEKTESLINDYRSDPQNGRKPLEKELVRLINKFTKGNFKEFYLNSMMCGIRSACVKVSASSDNTEPFPPSLPFCKAKEIYGLESDKTVFKEDADNCRNGRKALCLNDLLNIFRKMPKMGLLHMHTSASQQPEWIIDALADNDYKAVPYAVLGQDPQKRGRLTFSRPNGAENIDYAAVTRGNLDDEKYYENILKPKDGFDKYTTLHEELTDLLSFNFDSINGLKNIREELNDIFSRTDDLFRNSLFYKDYYTDAFKTLVDDNIEYLELRAEFGKFSDTSGSETEFLDILKEAENAAAEYAEAVGKYFKLRVILCGNRIKDSKFDVLKKMLKAAEWANSAKYSDMVIGFDIVSEENMGGSADTYSEFIINSDIYKYVNFYLHDCGNGWDFDPNMADALLLSNRRVGHGFGLNALPAFTDNLAFDKNTPPHKTVSFTPDKVKIQNKKLKRIEEFTEHVEKCEKSGGDSPAENEVKNKYNELDNDRKALEELEKEMAVQEAALNLQKTTLEKSKTPYEEFKEQLLSETVSGPPVVGVKASFLQSSTMLKAQEELLHTAESALDELRKKLADKKREYSQKKKELDTLKCNLLLSCLEKKVVRYEGHTGVLKEIHTKGSPIAIEVCPISNQMLGYTPDLRIHPANTLIHRGVQCVLANDVPQLFGNGGLSYDFLSAFLSWNLDIWQIKQLIVNSILYSAIPEDAEGNEIDNPYNSVEAALNRFNILWHKFLIDIVPEADINDDCIKVILENTEEGDYVILKSSQYIRTYHSDKTVGESNASDSDIIRIPNRLNSFNKYRSMTPDTSYSFKVYESGEEY